MGLKKKSPPNKAPKPPKPTKPPKPPKAPKPLKSPKSSKPAKAAKTINKAQLAKRKAASRSTERRERTRKANLMAKQHKEKLLNAKLSRQKQRNRAAVRMRRKMEIQRAKRAKRQKQKDQKAKGGGGGGATGGTESEDFGLSEDDALFIERQLKEDGYYRRFCMRVEDALASFLYFLTVTLRSERTFDWLVFLANNLGLYQEYEINDYGQRLSPRTGRPVLLSLGPLRVVQVVESANQVRSHWDPYIREYLRNSKLTTDCWRANRMALQVALCMDDIGNMYDMPIHESVMQKTKKNA